MKINYAKYHGLKNDFFLIDNQTQILQETDYAPLTQHICHRKTGLENGADGLILALPSQNANIKMRIINADGSEAEMCGNGIRCFAKWLLDTKTLTEPMYSVETNAGILSVDVLENTSKIGQFKINMGPPKLTREALNATGNPHEPMFNEAIEVNNTTYLATGVSMGNPHCIIFTDDIQKIPLAEIGPKIETLPLFTQKTNVEFVEIASPTHAKLIVWERGAGITQACGTGACATLVAGVLHQKLDRNCRISLPGGDLQIHWQEDSNLVYMTGPAEYMASGQLTWPHASS